MNDPKTSGPKIACICCTFLRPHLIGEAVDCFLRQDYPADRRELIVVDDVGQYQPGAADHLADQGVKFVSIPHRCRTLGEKRNLTAALAGPDVDAYAVWDDDDIYLPWHLSAIAAALNEGAAWVRPREIWIDRRGRLERKDAGGLFHGAWGFTRDAYARADGYPFMQSGQDQRFAQRLKNRLKLQSVDSLAAAERAGVDPRPSYVYRWFTTPAAWHISAANTTSYEQLGEKAAAELAGCEKTARIEPVIKVDWLRLVDAAASPPSP